MTRQILVLLDLHSIDENVNVDEMQAIIGLRRAIRLLQEYNETKEDEHTGEMLYSVGFAVGEENSPVQGHIVIGTINALSDIYTALENVRKMLEIASVPPQEMEEIIKEISKEADQQNNKEGQDQGEPNEE